MKELSDIIESAKKKLISTIIEKLPYCGNLEVYESSLSDRFQVFYIKEVYLNEEDEVCVKAREEGGEEFESVLDIFDINVIFEICEWILK